MLNSRSATASSLDDFISELFYRFPSAPFARYALLSVIFVRTSSTPFFLLRHFSFFSCKGTSMLVVASLSLLPVLLLAVLACFVCFPFFFCTHQRQFRRSLFGRKAQQRLFDLSLLERFAELRERAAVRSIEFYSRVSWSDGSYKRGIIRESFCPWF